MHRAVILIPLTTRSWSRSECVALHILEHLMMDGRGESRDEYFSEAEKLWLECLGTIRRNAALFESEVLPSYTLGIKKILTEAVTREPNWDYFEYEKRRVVEEVKSRSSFLIGATALYEQNFSGHYAYWPGGELVYLKKNQTYRCQKMLAYCARTTSVLD